MKMKMERYIDKVWFWTDSQIVLHWIKLHSSTLNFFVAKRVSEIQTKSTGIVWRHVPSQQNSADIVPRGASAQELATTIWYTGPEYL